MQIVGDGTSALSSVLKADVWRDHLFAEEVRLNARLAELDAAPPGESDARLEEMRDEGSGRLADMDAESGSARAAALLAGEFYVRASGPNQVLDLARRIKAGRQCPFREVGGAWSYSSRRRAKVDTWSSSPHLFYWTSRPIVVRIKFLKQLYFTSVCGCAALRMPLSTSIYYEAMCLCARLTNLTMKS